MSDFPRDIPEDKGVIAMALTEEQADAVHTLAEHYLAGTDIPAGLMLDAWRALVTASEVTLGNGWSTAQIEGSYEPMIHADDYSDDPEDCTACVKTDGDCERHTSLDTGMALLARAVRTLADEPEVLTDVLRQSARIEAETTHDVTDPAHAVDRCLVCRHVSEGTKLAVPGSQSCATQGCESTQQWFDPGRRQFECQRCGRKSPYLSR